MKPQEDLREYRVAKRFTILQVMGGLAVLGILVAIGIKVILASI